MLLRDSSSFDARAHALVANMGFSSAGPRRQADVKMTPVPQVARGRGAARRGNFDGVFFQCGRRWEPPHSCGGGAL